MLIRDLGPGDLGAVLDMNNAAVPAVNAHDVRSLEVLVEMADRSWVVDDGDALGGLLVTFAPGTGYDSANYRWLSQRFDDFRYVDRVVVAATHKRRGLGRGLYEVLEAHARVVGTSRLVCEVNVEPPNPQSIAFHTEIGWRPVDDLEHAPGKVVRYFEKPLT
ncbi:MAG: GNAT family N-acetyltransferase [Acidimicrobiia bacterium]|nr:GNAT family N-acetyltransferase [Acidimicrobiia bacterium]